MLHLIDANVIITAKDSYYAINQVPEFWDWLVHHGSGGTIKIPAENWDEVSPGPNNGGNPFHSWRQDRANRDALVLDEEITPDTLQDVLDRGYGPNLTDAELDTIGRNPFLVAYALADRTNRLVVTTEVSRPSAQRQNRKLPDVCRDFGITCWNTFQLTRALNFSTTWRSV